MIAEVVMWHDVECGSYAEDYALWRELAQEAPGGPILDVGAGTGRTALDLARAGHEVVALDVDPELLAELERRAGALPVRTACADARAFALGERFGLIAVPMQTIQLLGGEHGAFLACARRHLKPGGLVAAALALPPEYTGEIRPLPDMREHDGWLWASQPTAIRAERDGFVIERTRELVSPAGERTVTEDRIRLHRVLPDALEAAGRAAGLEPLPRRRIPETDDYVGSEVVVFRG